MSYKLSQVLIGARDLPPLAIGVSDAARLLNIRPETLRRHLKLGKIKGTNLGNWLVPVSEIERLLGNGISS